MLGTLALSSFLSQRALRGDQLLLVLIYYFRPQFLEALFHRGDLLWNIIQLIHYLPFCSARTRLYEIVIPFLLLWLFLQRLRPRFMLAFSFISFSLLLFILSILRPVPAFFYHTLVLEAGEVFRAVSFTIASLNFLFIFKEGLSLLLCFILQEFVLETILVYFDFW